MKVLILVAVAFLFIGCANYEQCAWIDRYCDFSIATRELNEAGCPALTAKQLEVFLGNPDMVVSDPLTLYQLLYKALQKEHHEIGAEEAAAIIMNPAYDNFCWSTGRSPKSSWRDDPDFCGASVWVYAEEKHFPTPFDPFSGFGFRVFMFFERDERIVSGSTFFWRKADALLSLGP